MNRADRSVLSTVTATLSAAGFKSHVPAGRARRKGYSVRALGGLFVFDNCEPGEFARVCGALVGAGFELRDPRGGQDHVRLGVARILPRAT